MASATEISTRALRRIRVVAPDESPSGQDVESTKEALTSLINAFEADGLTADVLPLDARFEQGLVAMLAVRIAEEYGKTPGPILLRDAANGEAQITAAFFAVPPSTFDDAIKNTGHHTDYGYIIGEPEDPYGDWEASTAYALRSFSINNKMLYECITAGTSASSGGPTGTDAEITDGTVTWCWRRVVG